MVGQGANVLLCNGYLFMRGFVVAVFINFLTAAEGYKLIGVAVALNGGIIRRAVVKSAFG